MCICGTMGSLKGCSQEKNHRARFGSTVPSIIKARIVLESSLFHCCGAISVSKGGPDSLFWSVFWSLSDQFFFLTFIHDDFAFHCGFTECWTGKGQQKKRISRIVWKPQSYFCSLYLHLAFVITWLGGGGLGGGGLGTRPQDERIEQSFLVVASGLVLPHFTRPSLL